MGRDEDITRGFAALRAAVLAALQPPAAPGLAIAGGGSRLGAAGPSSYGWLLSEVDGGSYAADSSVGSGYGDARLAASSEDSPEARERLIGLVELARGGDADAFGLLYDHYQPSIYRFLYYRTRSVVVAEDLTSETFFRALRNMASFRWQGKDFGAWLMTIARNLATDHFKAGRTRLEMTTEDMGQHDDTTDGPETAVLASLTNEILLEALTELPNEQKDCLVMRFLQGMSIAETAQVLGRSEGAIKQLQLRGVRNLAKLMPEGLR
ncbi:sigma-70 family RNA polymerase sigma factor [Nocardioides bizhenqiangii]|uniref:Sigma-70 family RNA polymerase sigma factor n=1 Tax=Nocardioides bizhenqiangii TaxID=3095076 RepID=A0ABZ0ZRT8_9ACTN|nr:MULTISPECIES: sigma-70 family RNA polymerase sigma factor [unclassified Nocardioides]MDZ5622691.1 sigma-70 family RNA polymerase sigma factor [Nocardioides sp. HM23]WQQ26958.1 sigma-70 family RNA polymerase sigma factor [Nocardioides sp. HM61]